MLNQRIRNWYRSERVHKSEWMIVILLSFFAFISFRYVDLDSLTVWSTNLLDVIFEGRPRDFYLYSFQNKYELAHQYVGCDVFALLPLSIWNIPIWIAQRFFNYEIMHRILPIFWSKLFLVACLCLSCYLCYRIILLVTGSKNDGILVMFLMASSLFVYLGIYYSGQNDIILILYFLLALYFILKKNMGLFILFAAFSVAVKPYFIFTYLAVLLLVEKNILKIIWKTALSCSILLLFKLLFLGAPLYTESLAAGPTNSMLRSMFSSGLSTSIGPASLLIVFMSIIYLICYTQKLENEQKYYDAILYFAMLSCLAFTVFSIMTFYRLILIVPFLSMIIVKNKRLFQLNIILEAAFTFTASFALFQTYPTFMSVKTLNHTIISKLIDPEKFALVKYNALYDLFAKNPRFETLTLIRPVLVGIFLAAAVLIAVINYPGAKLCIKEQDEYETCERWILWVRMLVPVIFLIVPFILLSKSL